MPAATMKHPDLRSSGRRRDEAAGIEADKDY
jgi:hypothetical protein